MLFNLSIENVALIEQANIDFNSGFTALTGETGAGKSMLINSVNMLLGERIGKDIIRHGKSYACVEGIFYVDDAVKNELLNEDIDVCEDNSLIVSRRLYADGKNVCKVGGKAVTVANLRDIGRSLINVHGQHDNQALLDSKCHISFLDAFCKKENCDIYSEYEKNYSELQECNKLLNELNIDENEKNRKVDILQFEIKEISNANISVGEENVLKSKRNFIKNKENFIKNCSGALSVLSDNEDETAYGMISYALKFIEKIPDDSLSSISEKLNDILFGIEDVSSDIRKKLDMINYEDVSLDDIEERLDIIYRLKRKYGNSEEDILNYCDNAQKELDRINFSDAKKAELEKQLNFLYKKTHETAQKLSAIRKKNALLIERNINSQLAELNMTGACFKINFEDCKLSYSGVDNVEFLISTNIGEPQKPLCKIISGGELSRIMLAMKNVLTDGDTAGTLIFDEIDTGISGITVVMVGTKLAEISKKKQVLCVTHSPQIAALADNHFKISKESDKEKTNTHIEVLSDAERIKQIAYMISGDENSETSLMQAKEMMK